MVQTPDENPNGQAELDELIGKVYDVALDASRYDILRQTWENLGDALLSSGDGTGARKVPNFIQSHFERAMLVLQQAEISDDKESPQALLAQFDNVAAMVLNPDMEITAINNAAKGNLQLSVGNKLSGMPIEPGDMNALSKKAADMFRSPTTATAIVRVRSVRRGDFLIFQMRRTEMKTGEAAIIAVTSDLHWPAGFQDLLRDAFELSSAEAEVVRLLIECSSVKEIAETRGRSIDTVRAQVKAILAKTETRSQIELVRLVLSMMDIASSAIGGEASSLRINKGGEALKSLPYLTTYDENDRRLDYLILGDPKGKPVLYITAEYGYIRWTASAEAAAAASGIKVIVPIRAGYGDSDLLPKNQEFCEGIAKDILCVLDAEGVESLPSVSISDDHNYAIQVEKMRPGTIKAIIGAAGGMPFLNEEQVQRMHKWYRFIQACARNTPVMLPYMLKMGFHLVRRVGKKSFLKTIFEGSPADLAAIENPEVFEALDAGSVVAAKDITRVCETFARQTIFEQDPALVDHLHWCRGRLPVHMLTGLQDPSQPPDTLAEQRAEFDWIDFRVFPDAGQLLLFTKWRDVLDLVEEYV